MPAVLTGIVGQIKWSYYMAGAIHGYTVSRTQGSWRLRGTLVQSDKFKLAQKPLTFVAPHQAGEWRWPILELTIREGAVTATLGSPEGS